MCLQSRLQSDLKAALDMQVSAAAQAAKERAQIKADAMARCDALAVTYSQEMQVVIDHVKKTDARASAAEQRIRR